MAGEANSLVLSRGVFEAAASVKILSFKARHPISSLNLSYSSVYLDSILKSISSSAFVGSAPLTYLIACIITNLNQTQLRMYINTKVSSMYAPMTF